MRSLAPKSVTTPIAMGIAERLGGLPSLAAVLVILTGILGAVCGSALMRLLKVRDEAATGFARSGIARHWYCPRLQIGETAGAFAALAMGLNGLFTAVSPALAVALLERWLGH